MQKVNENSRMTRARFNHLSMLLAEQIEAHDEAMEIAEERRDDAEFDRCYDITRELRAIYTQVEAEANGRAPMKRASRFTRRMFGLPGAPRHTDHTRELAAMNMD